MDVTAKLKLIQEGYSIDQINSGKFNMIKEINESSYDEYISLITESISGDIKYFTNLSLTAIRENASEQDNILKRFIKWIIEKIRQIKEFIMNLFKKKKREMTKATLSKLEKLANTDFRPFVVTNTLEKIINSPDVAINALKNVISQFEDITAQNIDFVYTGKNYDGDIKEDTDVISLKIMIWKRVLNNTRIVYDKNITATAIDNILGWSHSVEINSKEQIQNIIKFTDKFYDMWRDMNDALTYYENQIINLSQMTDDGFKIIKLSCEAMLETYPEIISRVDSYINKLAIIEQYLE